MHAHAKIQYVYIIGVMLQACEFELLFDIAYYESSIVGKIMCALSSQDTMLDYCVIVLLPKCGTYIQTILILQLQYKFIPTVRGLGTMHCHNNNNYYISV